MTVAGIAMVKDEADIIASTVSHMLEQVDFVVVADNGSTDGTRDMLETTMSERTRILVTPDAEVGYYQSRKMSRLAGLAAGLGADWVVPFDADELWVAAEPGRTVSDVLADTAAATAAAVILNHVSTDADPDAEAPPARMGWRLREPGALPKVACRPRVDVVIEQGNHGARYDTEHADGLLAIHHYPHRSVEQTIRKARNGAAAYAATDLPDDLGDHWRRYGAFTDEQLEGLFRDWWWFPNPAEDDRLVYDPVAAQVSP